MIYLFRELKLFLKSDFSFIKYSAILLFTAILVVLNYSLNIDETLNNYYRYTPLIFPVYLLRNIIAYFGAVSIIIIFGNVRIKKPKEFLIVSLLGIIVYSFYSKFYFYIPLIKTFDYAIRFYFHYVLSNVQGIVSLVLPLFIIYMVFNRKDNFGFYGIHFKNIKPFKYIDVFIIITLIVFIASLIGSITEFYPIYKYTFYHSASEHLGISNAFAIAGFELSYAIDFIFIELFFRGFLILGLIKYLGKDAILPMIVLYTVIHFGKPLPETISSFFGGYVLGVIAYSQKHIRIGIIFHLVLALGMELFAFLKLAAYY
jgi:hypothetical protein